MSVIQSSRGLSASSRDPVCINDVRLLKKVTKTSTILQNLRIGYNY